MNSVDEQESYLSNDLSDEDIETLVSELIAYKIPKLGPNRARSIVKAYGRRYTEALSAGPDGISLAVGIDESTRTSICREWEQSRIERDEIQSLTSLDIAQDVAERIRGAYPKTSSHKTLIERIQDEPYTSVFTSKTTFTEFEKLRDKLAIPRKHPNRLSCGVNEAITLKESIGDTAIEHVTLVTTAAKKLGIARAELSSNFWHLDPHGIWTYYNDRSGWTQVQHNSTRNSELQIANFVSRRSERLHEEQNQTAIRVLKEAIEHSSFPIDKEQIEAVITALTRSLTVITGRAGTGKTTIMKVLVNACKKAGLRVGGCAPTGLAAARLQHVTGMKCRTIHRMLGIARDGTRNTKLNEIEDYDVLVVDEFSMVGTFLGETLMSSIAEDTTVVFLGDSEQLSSIEPGSLLRDLATSPLVTNFHLTKVYRQGSGNDGSIVRAAWDVLDGKTPTFTTSTVFVEQRLEAKTARWISGIAEKIIAEGTTTSEVRVISPIRSGTLGVTALAAQLREKLNPPANESVVPDDFRVGDEIIYTENDETLGLSNGDLGRITTVDESKELYRVEFSRRRTVDLSSSELANIKHAMALTGHQTQGNEFAQVIIPLAESHRNMLDRAWLYTAIARAKDRVILVGSKDALEQALQREPRRRKTGLSSMLESKIR